MIISAQRGPDFDDKDDIKARTTERIRRRSFQDGGSHFGFLCRPSESGEIELTTKEARVGVDEEYFTYIVGREGSFHFATHALEAAWHLDMGVRIGEDLYRPSERKERWVKVSEVTP